MELPNRDRCNHQSVSSRIRLRRICYNNRLVTGVEKLRHPKEVCVERANMDFAILPVTALSPRNEKRRRPPNRRQNYGAERKSASIASSNCDSTIGEACGVLIVNKVKVHCAYGQALQYDHIRLVCLGKSHNVSNLHLTCRPCNQRFAKERLGQELMQSHLGRT